MITIVLFSRIRRKFRISRRAERVNYRPLKHPMDGRVEGSRVTQLRVANSYARNRKLARVCVQQMRRPREPRSEIFRALSLSSTPNARGGGRGRPLLCPAFGETRNRKSSSRMDCFPFFFFCRYSLSLFFFSDFHFNVYHLRPPGKIDIFFHGFGPRGSLSIGYEYNMSCSKSLIRKSNPWRVTNREKKEREREREKRSLRVVETWSNLFAFLRFHWRLLIL